MDTKSNIKPADKCRLCLASGYFHINIFDTNTTQNICDVIQEIFHCEINEFDSLPNHVCIECWMTTQKFHQFYRTVLSIQKKYLAGNYPEVKVEMVHDEIIGYYEGFLNSVSNREVTTTNADAQCDISMNTNAEPFIAKKNATEVDHLSTEDDSKIDDALSDSPSESDDCNDSESDEVNEDDMASDSDDFLYDPIKKVTRSGRISTKSKTSTKVVKRKRGRPKKVLAPGEVRQKWKRPTGRFKCPHCVKYFTRSYRVNVHIQLRHGFGCKSCDAKLSSEQKLKQHMSIHEDGFESKLRSKLEEVMAIDINEIDSKKKDAIMRNFDMKCDNCQEEFQSLNEAQSHYLSAHNAKGYIKCCEIKLREEGLIKEHVAYHIDPDSYQCFVCNLTVKLKSYFRMHLKNHVIELLENRNFICDVCDKNFKTKSNLLYHKAEVHAKEKIKCEICSKTFFDDRQKEKHMRNTHELMTLQMAEYVSANFDMACDQCDNMFESFQDAKRHYLTVHNDSRGYIKCCNIKLRNLLSIDEHINMHQNPEQMKCHICNKIFKIKDHLRTHIRRHGKSYTCETCGKSFKRSTTLTGHIKNVHHSAPRDFQCRFCSLRFNSEEKHNNHEQLIHFRNIENARIVCDICGKGFLQTSHLQKHVKTHHSTENEQKKSKEDKSETCTICGLRLSSRYRLKLHRKSHNLTEPNRCDQCGVEAPNHEALLGHIRAFHEIRRKHKCRLCDEMFDSADKLQEHATNHASEKLYQCTHCLESFIWKASLEAHMKKFHFIEREAEKNLKTTTKNKTT